MKPCALTFLKVSELWLREPKRWNIPLINHLFGPNFANHILQIPLSQSDGQDILIWKPNKSGRWTAQSAYKLIHEGAIQKTFPNLIPLWSRQLLAIIARQLVKACF